jgi:hypothetical protein
MIFTIFDKGLCLSHMFFLASSHTKKHKKRKMFSPHRNHDIHYYFSKLCITHEMKKKVISRYNTHKKFIMTHKN